MKSIRRTSLCAAVVTAALLITGCASGEAAPASTNAESTTPLTVALGFLPNVSYAGNFIADDKGYYDEAGLDVTLLAGGPNAPAPEVALATGQAQIAFESNTPRLFSYLADAQDIVIIGARMQISPNGLLSLAEHPVSNAGQLVGSKIIAGPTNRDNIDALMEINKVDSFDFIPGGADIGPLLNGDGDALLAFATNQPITLELQNGMTEGKDFFFTPFSDLDYHLMSEVVLVSRDYLEKNRDEVVAFMVATIRGWQAQIDDPQLGASLAVEKYGAELGLDLDQQIASSKSEVPFMVSANTKEFGLFYFDPAQIADVVYPSMEATGLAGLPAVESVTDTSVLTDAWAILK